MRFLHKSCFVMAVAALISSGLSVEAANPRTGRITLPVMTPITVKLERRSMPKLLRTERGSRRRSKTQFKLMGKS